MPSSILRALWDASLSKDSLRRHEARFRLLDGLARRAGFRVYNKGLVWHEDAAYREVWSGFQPRAGEIKDRKFVLYSMARSVASLAGDTAECGVYEGASSFLICAATQGDGVTQHHVFDSFQGLSKPLESDLPEDPRAFRWRENDLAMPLEVVARALARFPRVELHPGWIPERFGEVAERRFKLVHVDVDLYQPTRDSLAFFYERLVPGGILVCDDYGFATCPGARRAFDELAAAKPDGPVIHLTTGQGFLVKRGAAQARPLTETLPTPAASRE